MKRKVICYIGALAFCAIISLYSVKNKHVTSKETVVQEDIYASQNLKNTGSIKSTASLKKVQLLEDASIETSAMAMWEHSNGKTFVSWLLIIKKKKRLLITLTRLNLVIL